MKSWLQRKFIRFLVKHLFNTVGEDDIFVTKLKNNHVVVYKKGKPLTHEYAILLKERSQNLLESDYWRHVNEEVKYQINKRMYYKSESPKDLMAGKAMLYSLDILNSVLKRLSNLK